MTEKKSEHLIQKLLLQANNMLIYFSVGEYCSSYPYCILNSHQERVKWLFPTIRPCSSKSFSIPVLFLSYGQTPFLHFHLPSWGTYSQVPPTQFFILYLPESGRVSSCTQVSESKRMRQWEHRKITSLFLFSDSGPIKLATPGMNSANFKHKSMPWCWANL